MRNLSLLFLVMIFGTANCAATAATPVEKVVDYDRPDLGVPAVLKRVNADGSEISVARSSRTGEVDQSFECRSPESLIVSPKDPAAYHVKRMDCPVVLSQVTLLARGRMLRIQRAAETAVALRDFGGAVLAYNELAVRARSVEEVDSLPFEAAAYQSAGEALGVGEPFGMSVRDESRKVPSPQLVNAISDFQEDKGLAVTGKLDYPTAKALAGKPAVAVIFEESALRKREM